MPKPIEVPSDVAQSFVQDMRTFFAEPNTLKADEIAVRQLHTLNAYRRPRDKKLRLADVKRMFVEMKDQI